MKTKKIVKKIKNKIIYYKNILTTKPSWLFIKEGPLKGGFVFVNKNLYDGWGDMEYGIYDKFIYNFLSDKDILGFTVWDVGGHFGYHTLSFAKLVGKNGKVLTFEPNPFNIERLKMNIEKNTDITNRISIIDKALSDKTVKTLMEISDDVDGSQSSGSYLKEIKIKPLNKKAYRNFKEWPIEAIKIDDFILKNKEKDPDIIKIDIEGAEFLALSGATELLKRKHPMMFIEIHDIINMFNIEKMLLDMNYKIELLDKENASSSRCFIVAY